MKVVEARDLRLDVADLDSAVAKGSLRRWCERGDHRAWGGIGVHERSRGGERRGGHRWRRGGGTEHEGSPIDDCIVPGTEIGAEEAAALQGQRRRILGGSPMLGEGMRRPLEAEEGASL